MGCELNKLLEAQEVLWRQRSRVQWLKLGDQNSKFFHESAKQRGRRNKISGIFDVSNCWKTNEEDIANTFVNYFHGLFTSSYPEECDEILNVISPVLDDDMNNVLCKCFSREEIEFALNQMAPSKAPGDDGMPAIFYQHCWEIVGNDVVNVCLQVFNEGKSVKDLNHTLIALIPKVKNPTLTSEFRPISLCNVAYKLISKTVANRLKKVLPLLISEFQSAFVPKRLITDNILVAFETVHAIKRRGKKGKKKMSIKIDMEKAYDRVEWNFLLAVMKRLGFREKWISLIHDCISSVTYSILCNGEKKGFIKPTRGLRTRRPIISIPLPSLWGRFFSSLNARREGRESPWCKGCR